MTRKIEMISGARFGKPGGPIDKSEKDGIFSAFWNSRHASAVKLWFRW